MTRVYTSLLLHLYQQHAVTSYAAAPSPSCFLVGSRLACMHVSYDQHNVSLLHKTRLWWYAMLTVELCCMNSPPAQWGLS